MLILLPPSEGKVAGGGGAPLDYTALSWPQLTPERERVVRALVTLCRSRPARARELLGLSEALDDDRAANAELEASPTQPAGHRYVGVLHDALGYPSLTAAARRRADAAVVTFSGLWGATRPCDLLPRYRLGIATRLPRLAALPAYWRGPLTATLDGAVAEHGALDLRSSGYSAMYRPSAEAACRLTDVRIVGPDGTRAAASYQSKLAKGQLVRAMLRRGAPSVERLVTAAAEIGVEADSDGSRILVRLPAGWGLVGGS